MVWLHLRPQKEALRRLECQGLYDLLVIQHVTDHRFELTVKQVPDIGCREATTMSLPLPLNTCDGVPACGRREALGRLGPPIAHLHGGRGSGRVGLAWGDWAHAGCLYGSGYTLPSHACMGLATPYHRMTPTWTHLHVPGR